MAKLYNLNTQTLLKIRKARGFSQAQVAEESDIKPADYAAIEKDGTPISIRKTLSIAKTFAVPPQFLFFSRVIVERSIPDFRTKSNKPAVLTPSGLNHIERAKSILDYLSDHVFLKNIPNRFPQDNNGENDDISKAVRHLKHFYKKETSGAGKVDPAKTFRETRVAIESAGVLVICDRVPKDDFRGFCFSSKSPASLIFVNTSNQRPQTKCFTLMHELVHVYINESGVSDPSVLKNNIERFCNKVVAQITMPESEFKEAFFLIRSTNPRYIVDRLSGRFGTSKQATAIRITELNLINDFYSEWLEALPPKIPVYEEEDDRSDEDLSSGGGIGAQISRFGYLLPKLMGTAIKERKISPLDAFRLTNLKPATFDKLIENSEKRLG